MIWLITACSESPPPAAPSASPDLTGAGQGTAAPEDHTRGAAAHNDSAATAAQPAQAQSGRSDNDPSDAPGRDAERAR